MMGRGAVLSPYGSDGDDAESSSHDHVLPRLMESPRDVARIMEREDGTYNGLTRDTRREGNNALISVVALLLLLLYRRRSCFIMDHRRIF